MANFVRIAPGALVVGKPLPWTVYDASGNVLLRQGNVIHTDKQLEQLFERGLFQPCTPTHPTDTADAAADGRERNPFAEYPGLLRQLERTLVAVTRRKPDATKRLLGLAGRINRMCRHAPDASLALVHLYAVEPTFSEQTLFYAILCHFTARELGFDDQRTSVLMAAALAANVALMPVADRLNASHRILTAEQRQVVSKHPQLSVDALEAAGVTNTLLLGIIAQHHERPDGSGYPQGLTGEEILPEAQILALAERYVALITRRAYRERFSVTNARRAVTRDMANGTVAAVPQALLAALTEFPPGTLVRLANNEVAMITHRPQRYRGALAQALFGPQGGQYLTTYQRDCSMPEFSILTFIQPEPMPSMNFGLLWGFC